MTHLRQLGLANAQMNDQELAGLKGFKELQDLDLDNTPITDAQLENLRGMTRLQSLNLERFASCLRTGYNIKGRGCRPWR